MYVNAEMIPVETVPEIQGERVWKRAVEGMNSSMIYLIHCKKLCKYSNVPPPSITIIIKNDYDFLTFRVLYSW
jgi:hypothetical protein